MPVVTAPERPAALAQARHCRACLQEACSPASPLARCSSKVRQSLLALALALALALVRVRRPRLLWNLLPAAPAPDRVEPPEVPLAEPRCWLLVGIPRSARTSTR